jgi:hypothetical protein
MGELNFSSFTNEEDLQILLDAIQEERLIDSLLRHASTLSNYDAVDIDKIAEIIVDEFFKTAGEAQDPKSVEQEKDYFNFSLSGYNLDTWVDYWFGMSQPGANLEYNGIFFDLSNRNINLLQERIKTLSKNFGYKLTKNPEAIKEVTLKETPKETKSSPLMKVNVTELGLDPTDLEKKKEYKAAMIADFQMLKQNPTKEAFTKFIQKFPKLFVSTSTGKYVGADRPAVKRYVKETIYNLRRKNTEYLETGGVSMAPGLETIGAGSGEKGTQAAGESAGAKHEMERYIAWYQDMLRKQPENDAVIEQSKAILLSEAKALEEQIAQAEQAGQNTSALTGEINKRMIQIGNLDKQKTAYGNSLERLNWKIQKTFELIQHYQTVIENCDNLLKSLSPSPDLTIEDYDLLTNESTVLGQFGKALLMRLGLFASKDVYFPELVSEEHAGSMVDVLSGMINKDVTNISDEMFNYTKDDLMKLLSKNIAENDANKLASKSILDAMLSRTNDIITRYQVIKEHIEEQKNMYIEALKNFNNPKTGIYSSVYGKLNKLIADCHKKLRLKDPAFLTETQKNITGLLNTVRQVEKTSGSLFDNKELNSFIKNNKEFGKAKEILKPYRNLFNHISSLMNVLLDISPEKAAATSSILEEITYTKNMLDALGKTIKKILNSQNANQLPKEVADLLNKYSYAVGSIRRQMKDGLIGAYGVSFETVSEKLQGAELLKSALDHIKEEGHADVNSFKSMLSLFKDIPRFMGYFDVSNLDAVIGESTKNLRQAVLGMEGAIKPLKDQLNTAVNEKTLAALVDQQKNALVQEVNQDVGPGYDEARYTVASRINNEFNPQKQMMVDVIGDMNSSLWQDWEYTGNADQQKKDYHMKTRNREEMISSQWNFYNIMRDWNNVVVSCLKSLASARKNETRTFNPKDSFGYRPNFVPTSADEKASTSSVNAMHSYITKTFTDSLATIMSEPARNKQIDSLRFDVASDFNTFIDLLNDLKTKEIVKKDNSRIQPIQEAIYNLNKLTTGYKNYASNAYRVKSEKEVELKNLMSQLAAVDDLLENIRERIDSTKEITEKDKLMLSLKENIKKNSMISSSIKSLKMEINSISKVDESVDLINPEERDKVVKSIIAAVQAAESFPGELEYYKKIAIDLDDKFKQFDIIKKAQEEKADKELLFKMLYAPSRITRTDRDDVEHMMSMANLYRTYYSRDFGKNIDPSKYKAFISNKRKGSEEFVRDKEAEVEELLKISHLLDMSMELNKIAQEEIRLAQLEFIDNYLNKD